MTKLIIFEGISGSGKSTLYSYTRKLDNHGNLNVHRFTPTQWVYSKLYNREFVDYEIFNTTLQKIVDVYIIWCDCEGSVAIKRQKEKNDDVVEDLEQARILFEEYFAKITTFKKVLYLRTDLFSVDECMKRIEKFLI